MKGILIRVVIILITGGIFWYWYNSPVAKEINSNNVLIISGEDNFQKKENNEFKKKVEVGNKNVVEKKTTEGNKLVKEKKQDLVKVLVEDIKIDVPFILQAPKFQWTDKKFQDACEEASILMAHRWKNGNGKMSKNAATKELEKMFKQESIFFDKSNVIDTSVEDTARFAREYFREEFEVVDVTMNSIYTALANGSIVIVPTNGKMLNNPNFSNGGPERHMLIITGYDESKKEFITNDPGTRKGEGYQYPRSRLYNAVRDYKTGNKEPINGVSKKMILVEK